MVSFFGKKDKKIKAFGDPIPIEWARSESGRFYNLIAVKEDELNIKDMGGVFIIWYHGVSSSTVYVGAATNLIDTIKVIKDNPQIIAFHEKGDLGITWSTISEKYRYRILAYLRAVMNPVIPTLPELEESAEPAEPFAVTLPYNV